MGSQVMMVGHSDLPRVLRMSEEFDAYPENYREWEKANPGEEASETINALLGEGSRYHETHGFFVDGVDANTARLPPDWRERAVTREIDLDGRVVRATAPESNDPVVSKLVRGDPKDIVFTRICLRQGLVRHDQLKNRLEVLLTGQQLELGSGPIDVSVAI